MKPRAVEVTFVILTTGKLNRIRRYYESRRGAQFCVGDMDSWAEILSVRTHIVKRKPKT